MNNDYIAVIYMLGSLIVLLAIAFYYILYIFLKSGDGKHTMKGIEQSERQAKLKQVMKERESNPDYGYQPVKMDYGSNSYPDRTQLYPRDEEDDVADNEDETQTTSQTQPSLVKDDVQEKPKQPATELDNQADPKADVLVNADGEPILTKDLNRPSFQEISDKRTHTAPLPVDDETNSVSIQQGEEGSESSFDNNEQEDEPTDWDALFKAAAQLTSGK